MKIRSFKNTRNFHKWSGMVCALFFLILALSGFLLMHYESLGLNKVEISGQYLPDKYFEIASTRRNIQTLAAAPGGNLYVGTDHGLYRSRDRGKNWVELKQGLFHQDIRVLALNPAETNVLYAGTPGGIFKTEDGGDHWTDWFDASSGLVNAEINDIVIHPEDPEKIFAATEGGLFRSADAGESWEQVYRGNASEKAVRFVRLSAVDPARVYIATPAGMHRNHDGLQQWEPVWRQQISEPLSMISLNTDPEFLYMGTGNGLFKSFNRGRTWVKDPDRNIQAVHSILPHPRNIADLAIVSGEHLLLSLNGGDSWNEVNFRPGGKTPGASSSRPFAFTHIYRDGPVFLAGTNAGLFLSRDKGRHWSAQALSPASQQPQERKMDLVKMITEIHTGRFFGSYFVLLVDLATLGLVLLVISGIWVGVTRNKIRKARKGQPVGELEADLLTDVREAADDLSSESLEIHDMIEHISEHLEKCKSVYMSKGKKEIEEIDRHITTLDQKMHLLMRRIGEFEKY